MTAAVTVVEWRRVFHEQATRFQDAVRTADPGTPVPSEPGWSLRDLVLHTALFAEQVTTYLSTGSRRQLRPGPVPETAAPLELLDSALANCREALANTPSHRPVWTFSPTAPDLAWVWHRRAAQELNLRRWDAEAALRILGPTDEDTALDGVDEVLGTLLAAKYGLEPTQTRSGTALVGCAGRAWHVTLTPGLVPEVVGLPAGLRSVAPPDATLDGSAPSVLYQLRNRALLTGTGDQDLLRALVVR
jgi:Mycothiol maleylpyruvate isomerase N-terminal domain